VSGDWCEIRESPRAAAPSRCKIGMLVNADTGEEGREVAPGVRCRGDAKVGRETEKLRRGRFCVAHPSKLGASEIQKADIRDWAPWTEFRS